MRGDLCATVQFCIVVVLWPHFKSVMYIFEQASVRYNFNWSVSAPFNYVFASSGAQEDRLHGLMCFLHKVF
jgi:hypothetical protein